MARNRGIIVDGVSLDEKQCRAIFGDVFAAARREQRLKWWLKGLGRSSACPECGEPGEEQTR